MRHLNQTLLWKLPLITVVMSIALYASLTFERVAESATVLGVAFGTPLLVALILRDKRALPTVVAMLVGCILFAAVMAVFSNHAQAWTELMVERVMPIALVILVIALPYYAIATLVRRLRRPSWR